MLSGISGGCRISWSTSYQAQPLAISERAAFGRSARWRCRGFVLGAAGNRRASMCAISLAALRSLMLIETVETVRIAGEKYCRWADFGLSRINSSTYRATIKLLRFGHHGIVVLADSSPLRVRKSRRALCGVRLRAHVFDAFLLRLFHRLDRLTHHIASIKQPSRFSCSYCKKLSNCFPAARDR